MSHHGHTTRLSFDHKPYDIREELRIRAHGGFVYPNGRLMNNISVCRGIGDSYLSDMFSSYPFVSMVDLSAYGSNSADSTCMTASDDMLLIEEVDFKRRMSLAGGQSPGMMTSCDDMIVILGCDGVWDVVSDAQAGRLATSVIEAGGTCQTAADHIKDLAYSLGSDDNISVLVIRISV